MATSLLRLGRHGGEAAEIFAAFLGADFDKVLALFGPFWAAHADLMGRDGSASLLVHEDEEPADDQPAEEEDAAEAPRDHEFPHKLGKYMIVELVRALGLIADSLRLGNDQRLGQAIAKLDGLADLATRVTSDELWVLINLIQASARGFRRNSLHARITALPTTTQALQSRMWRFAREQFARGRGILWASQVQGLDRLVASDSFALCTPTGSGKTLVANLALVKELLLQEHPEGEAPLALYLVPSRALAGEVEAKLTGELGGDLTITGLYGGADWGITDYWLTSNEPVRAGPGNLDRSISG
jgi:ATP-dependent helicase YprA (DUF1998 family)